MNQHPTSVPNANAFAGLIAFGFIFVAIIANGGVAGPARAVLIVAGHFAAIALAMLVVGSSLRGERLHQFSVLAMLGVSSALAIYLSLIRICLSPVPVDNLTTGGWIGLIVIATMSGWSLITVITECTSCVVWWLTRIRQH